MSTEESIFAERTIHQHCVMVPPHLLDGLLEEIVLTRRSERRWKNVKRAVFASLLLAYLMVEANVLGFLPSWARWGTHQPGVAVVELDGPITAGEPFSADLVVPILNDVCGSAKVDGVVLHINSPGGSPDEANRIGHAIDACRAGATPKRVVAVIEGMGASAAYLVALHADEITAGQYALVGSIGAIIQGLDVEDGLARLGIRSRVYASGSQKGAGSLVRHDTPDQARTLQAIADASGRQFAAEVERRRGAKLIPAADRYSGRLWTAQEAKTLGLVDRVGVFEELVDGAFPGRTLHRRIPRQRLADTFSLEAIAGAMVRQLTAQSAVLSQ